jgi:hypothetical protein
MVDYQVFHLAGERFLSGEMLYRAADGHYQFKYMPFSAAYFMLFSLLPLVWGKFAWFIAMVVSSTIILCASFKLSRNRDQLWLWIVLPTLLVMLRFYYRELELGQSNVVMFALLMLMVHFLLVHRDKTAGLMLGIAVTLKPYAIIFLPYLLLKRRWQAVGVFFVYLSLALCLPVLGYDWQGNLGLLNHWLISLSHSTPGLLTNADNISFFGMYAKWFGTESLSLIYTLAFVTIIVIGIIFLFAMFRRRSSDYMENAESALIIESSILLALMPLISPQGWDYVFLGGTLGVMLLISHRRIFPGIIRWLLYIDLVIIAFTLYDILGRSLYRSYMDASILTLGFLYLIVLLFWMRLFRKADIDPGSYVKEQR